MNTTLLTPPAAVLPHEEAIMSRYERSALSDNTHKVYHRAHAHFIGWCRHNGLEDDPAAAVLQYLDARRHSDVAIMEEAADADAAGDKILKRFTPPTLSSTIAALRHHGLLLPHHNRMLKGMQREVAAEDATPRGSAVPARAAQVLEALKAEGEGGVNMTLRDRAIIGLCWLGFLRLSEALKLSPDDINTRDGGLEITLRTRKTRQTTSSRVDCAIVRRLSPLTPGADAATLQARAQLEETAEAAIIAVRNWLTVRHLIGVPAGAKPRLFCVVSEKRPASQGAPLGEGAARNAIARLNPQWTGHSMRRGAAQDFAAAGVSAETTRLQGDWSTDDMLDIYKRR